MRDANDRLMCDVPFCPATSSRAGRHWICSAHWDCVSRNTRNSWHLQDATTWWAQWPTCLWEAITGGHIMRRRQHGQE